MKNIFLLIALLFSFQSKAQIDTLNYLKQFEVNKANYIGQSFSKLLIDLNLIKPKMVWIKPLYHGVRKFVDITVFCVDEKFPFNYNNRTVNTNAKCLYIEWDNYIDVRDFDFYFLMKKNKNHFTNDEKSFYGSRIIKDIKVY